MTYSAASIANAFLNIASSTSARISPMKMQKLVYLAHGYSLIELDRPLVNEYFEAWQFGPVLPSLYQCCKKFGKGPITERLSDSGHGILYSEPAAAPNDAAVQKILDFVWRNYGHIDAMELSAWTHEKGGPWDYVIHSIGLTFRNQQIDNDLIKEYFQNRMTPDSDEEAQET